MRTTIEFCVTHRSPWVEDEYYGYGLRRGVCLAKNSGARGVCLPTEATVTWGESPWKKEGEYEKPSISN